MRSALYFDRFESEATETIFAMPSTKREAYDEANL